jgi:hypothetical protein
MPPGPDNPTKEQKFEQQIRDQITAGLNRNGLSLAGDINVDLGPADQRELRAQVLNDGQVQFQLVFHGVRTDFSVGKPDGVRAAEWAAAGAATVAAPWAAPALYALANDGTADFQTTFDLEVTGTVELPGTLLRGTPDAPWDNLRVSSATVAATHLNVHPENAGAVEASFADSIRRAFGAKSWFDPGSPQTLPPDTIQAALGPLNRRLESLAKSNQNQVLHAALDPSNGGVLQLMVVPSPDQTVDYGD